MRAPRTMLAGALVTAAAIGAAGCGGGGSGGGSGTSASAASDRVQVLATARRYTAAFLDGDYTSACALLTPAARAQMTSAAQATKLGGGTCAGIMEAAAGPVSAQEQGSLDGLDVRIVSLDGDRAVVRTSAGGMSDTTPLQRVGGVWRVDAGL